MVLGDHLKWPGANLSGWEGTIVHDPPLDKSSYGVKFPWWKKVIFIPYHLVCPVYNDCEVCGYGAWRAVNYGTDKAPDWHHFCAWHLPDDS